MKRMAGIAAPILIALLAGPAVAEDATPNLVGEWSGVADAVGHWRRRLSSRR